LRVAWNDVPTEAALTDCARAGRYSLVRGVVLAEPEAMVQAERQAAEEEAAAAAVQ
jgi:hypothetical protein